MSTSTATVRGELVRGLAAFERVVVRRTLCLTMAAGLLVAKVPCAYAQTTTAFKYDSLGRLIQVDKADGKQTVYDYDEAGNRSVVDVKNSNTPTITRVRFSPGTVATNGTTTLTWTASGATSSSASCSNGVSGTGNAGSAANGSLTVVAGASATSSASCTVSASNGSGSATPVAKGITVQASANPMGTISRYSNGTGSLTIKNTGAGTLSNVTLTLGIQGQGGCVVTSSPVASMAPNDIRTFTWNKSSSSVSSCNPSISAGNATNSPQSFAGY